MRFAIGLLQTGLILFALVSDCSAQFREQARPITKPPSATPNQPDGATPTSPNIPTQPSSPVVDPSGNAVKTVGAKAGEGRDDNGLSIRLNWCPPGKFKMGFSWSPPVDVNLTKGFWIGRYEVTQEEYAAVMGTGGLRIRNERRSLPITALSWENATSFCEKLTQQELAANRLPSGWEYRLPTEAQWEYACRAGTTTQYCFGDATKDLNDYAWFDDNTSSALMAVGQKKSNEWGLHDMHGNAWEWCRDYFATKLLSGDDPEATTVADRRTIKGGSRNGSGVQCASAIRNSVNPGEVLFDLGFRIALVQVEQTAGLGSSGNVSKIGNGEITLPAGYVHERLQGIDSQPGKISKAGELEINYEIGRLTPENGHVLGGDFIDRTKRVPKDDQQWNREQIVADQPVNLVLRKDGYLLAAFPESGVNFEVQTASETQIEEALSIILSYRSLK